MRRRYRAGGSGPATSATGPEPPAAAAAADHPRIHDAYIDPLFEATIEATEEAVFDAMIAAETLQGRAGNTLFALPHDRLRELLSAT